MAIGVWIYAVLGATQDSLLRERELLDAPFGESHSVASNPTPPANQPAPETLPRKRRRTTPRRP